MTCHGIPPGISSAKVGRPFWSTGQAGAFGPTLFAAKRDRCAVLEVILRKAEQIRKATGVTVPLPDERGAVTAR